MDEGAEQDLREALHELKQPLNVIRLASGNIRNRIGELLDGTEGDYLATKLDRIEDQTQRAAEIVEKILASRARPG